MNKLYPAKLRWIKCSILEIYETTNNYLRPQINDQSVASEVQAETLIRQAEVKKQYDFNKPISSND